MNNEDTIDLITQYNEWLGTVKQQKFDESPEAFIKWKAREDAIERLIQVADYVDQNMPHPTDPEFNTFKDIQFIVEGRAT